MREVDFIFVANNAGTNVVTSMADAWEVTSGIRINEYSYARTTGMNLRGGFITARVKGSKATKSDNNYPTGAEIVHAMEKAGDLKIHFGNSSRGTLWLSWKEYEAARSYTDVLIGQVQKLTMAALGEVDLNKAAYAILNYTPLAQKAVGTAAANTELSGYTKSAVKLLAGKDVPVLFNISNRKRGGDFTEIRKKRRIASFRQIAGILAGTDMTADQYETFELGDTEDVLGAIDDALGSN